MSKENILPTDEVLACRPDRQSIRLKGWDYSGPGCYFITICTQDSQHVFGSVVKGQMVLNEAGHLAHEMWLAVEKFHPEYQLDEFVVMPNHVHGVVHIARRGGSLCPPEAGPTGLADFVRRYKSTVDVAWRKTTAVSGTCPDSMRNGKLWHRNYYEMIVRDDTALQNIRTYIRFNPLNFDAVMNCGKAGLSGRSENPHTDDMGETVGLGRMRCGRAQRPVECGRAQRPAPTDRNRRRAVADCLTIR